MERPPLKPLQHAGIWDAVQPKIVYAENISMAKQYGTSKNADAVFTAYSLLLKEAGKVIQVDAALHTPIVQKLGIVARSGQIGDAQSFTRFVLGQAGPSDSGALRIQDTLTLMKYTRFCSGCAFSPLWFLLRRRRPQCSPCRATSHRPCP